MTRAERREMWVKRIQDYKASGQSVRKWSEANNVCEQQVHYWLRKFSEPKTDESSLTAWLEAVVTNESRVAKQPLLFVKVGKAQIEVKPGFDPVLLAEVTKVLCSLC